MSAAHQCLNCNHPLQAAYCAHCGQSANTHRYSLKHFIEHDLVHGIWHVDKGVLYTIKELFSRPGHSVREFVQGKRVGYFNFVTLIVLIIGTELFLGSFGHVKLTDITPESSKAAMSILEEFTMKHPKAVPLLMIPLTSLFSYLWFRKAKLNGTEHVILNAYKTAGEMIIALLFTLIAIFYKDKAGLYLIYGTIGLLTTAYAIWFYYQFFSAYGYKKYSLLIRSIMVPISMVLLSIVIGLAWAVVAKFK
jgi:hypothetical protein